jgi:hypothetical protein
MIMGSRVVKILSPMILAGAVFVIPQPAGATWPCWSFGWTISASSTDPDVNVTTYSTGTEATAYLWFLCDAPQGAGLSAAEFSLDSSNPANVILAFTSANGFLNVGDPVNLLLAAACPSGPTLAGSILMSVNGPGSICIGPSPGGIVGSWNCDPEPVSDIVNWVGLDFGGGSCSEGVKVCLSGIDFGACCFPDGTCFDGAIDPGSCESEGGEFHGCVGCPEIPCQPISIERERWGRTKTRYR